MTHKWRFRLFIISQVLNLVVILLALIWDASRELRDQLKESNFGCLLIIGLLFLVVTPFHGFYAFIISRRELRNSYKSTPSPRDVSRLRIVSWMGVVISILGCATIACTILVILSMGTTEPWPPKERIENALYSVAGAAHYYRLLPSSAGGGNGSYLGFKIPRLSGVDSSEGYSLHLIGVWSDSIVAEGRYDLKSTGSIRVLIDSSAKIRDLQLFGDFK